MGRIYHLLAFDLGASNGRAIWGRFDGERLEMQELHRFENAYVEMNGVYYWDLPYLYQQLKEGFLAFRRLNVGTLDCFGIDSWGTDYGLLDKNGHLLGNPRAYRMSVDADMERVWKIIDYPTLYRRNGLGVLNFKTLYQLYRRKMEGDPTLECAKTLLFTPDLLGYFLTGEIRTEYTSITTSMLGDAAARDWDWESIDALGLPRHIFTPIDRAGTIRGALRPELAEELGVGSVPFAAVGTHDTSSAVAAIPGSGDFAFCSSGTWSLVGVESPEPILTDAAREAGFSNEGTVQGGIRFQRNIMGLWLIQECRRDWEKQLGRKLSWDEIVEAAEAAEPFRTVIHTDDRPFFGGGDMVGRIQAYCRKAGEPVPETVGQIARTIYESLALKYRWTLEHLEEILGRKLNQLNLVGGGSKNLMLNQMAADATGRKVIAGPTEGAAIGNLLMQAKALGLLHTMEDVRRVVRRSATVREYEPHHTPEWEAAYQRLLKQIS